MSNFQGYSPEQKYRVAWRTSATGKEGATESMTIEEARYWKREYEAQGQTECWIEHYNHYEWERIE